MIRPINRGWVTFKFLLFLTIVTFNRRIFQFRDLRRILLKLKIPFRMRPRSPGKVKSMILIEVVRVVTR